MLSFIMGVWNDVYTMKYKCPSIFIEISMKILQLDESAQYYIAIITFKNVSSTVFLFIRGEPVCNVCFNKNELKLYAEFYYGSMKQCL